MIRLFSLLFLLICSACIQLGSEPHPTRYYLLEPVADISTNASEQPLQLELSPIEFPSYLDRPQIVSRTADNGILVAEYDRWAEPLSDNLTRTLQENLRNQRPSLRISSAPWNNHNGPEYLLRITVNRFDGILGQQTDADIRWTLIDYKNGQELARRHFQRQVKIESDYQGLIDGLSRTLAELSREVTTILAEQH